MSRKTLNPENVPELEAIARQSSADIVTMTTLAASGHPGGSMSTIDILLYIYATANVSPAWKPDRDYVVISNGHVSPAVYCTLAANGFFNRKDAISQFRLAGSIFEGHVEPDVPGVEWASGNLGQGLSAACGFALASRMKKIDNHIYVIMGDGEQQKGQISEARRFAVKYKLNNITAIVDWNKLQIGGNIADVMPQNIQAGYEADGWHVVECDGHNFQSIEATMQEAASIDKPTVVMARTVMGKGVSFMENKAAYHGAPLKPDMLAEALKELEQPNLLEKYKVARSAFVSGKKQCEKPDRLIMNTGKPRTYDSKTDNRSAWGNALVDIADANACPIAVFDCDLAGSVKVNEFAEKHPEGFFQGGIMEHNTAVVAAAMSKAGILSWFADFGVFGVSETYNQHRLSDINKTNLKLITTHVGLDVGEDGKTHQCIDYLGVMRNLYNFNVIVPADPNQTDRIIRYIAKTPGNFLVPMGRSKLECICQPDGNSFFGDGYNFEFGKADLLREGSDAALFVMGTLAGRAVEISDSLAESGISLQVWNASCPEELNCETIRKAAATGLILTYEDHNIRTGLGSIVGEKIAETGLSVRFKISGVEDYAFSGNS
ncbi:MAG: transketolase, partial [Candidatus Cloacimonetes bacterium]|nr:transketolase [Candidatus Cloacimonadota bacterium]